MRYAKTLGLAGLAVAAMMVGVGSASATELTSPVGTKLGVGAGVKVEGTTQLDGSVYLNCKTTMEGTISNAGGEGASVKVNLSKLTYFECHETAWANEVKVTVLAPGNLELHAAGNGNGTLASTGARITMAWKLFGFPLHCIYVTNSTNIGTLTGSSTTKGTATLESSSLYFPQEPTSAECNDDSELTGSYKVTSPDYLGID